VFTAVHELKHVASHLSAVKKLEHRVIIEQKDLFSIDNLPLIF
jgi:threonyl-tRNA synthetase